MRSVTVSLLEEEKGQQKEQRTEAGLGRTDQAVRSERPPH
jgi:hypothetical protein